MSLEHGEDRAVSPVIAVILMVAIVVILAAVVGVYVLNFGDATAEPAPTVRLDAVYDERTSGNGQYLNVTVEGGDRAQTAELEFVVTGATDDGGNAVSLDGDPLDQIDSELITADVISIDANSFSGINSGEHLDLSDASVTLVWDPEPDDGEPGQTQPVWSWEAD